MTEQMRKDNFDPPLEIRQAHTNMPQDLSSQNSRKIQKTCRGEPQPGCSLSLGQSLYCSKKTGEILRSLVGWGGVGGSGENPCQPTKFYSHFWGASHLHSPVVYLLRGCRSWAQTQEKTHRVLKLPELPVIPIRNLHREDVPGHQTLKPPVGKAEECPRLPTTMSKS